MKTKLVLALSLLIFTCGTQAGGIEDGTAGVEALKRGSYDEAIRLFTKAIKGGDLTNDDLEFAYFNRGQTYLDKGDKKHAIADLKQAVRLNPDDTDAQRSLHLALSNQGSVSGPVPAVDRECGSMPVAPAIPSANNEASKSVEDARTDAMAAYYQVTAFQSALKPFCDCLIIQARNDQAVLANAAARNDQTQISAIKQALADRQKIYDVTVDTEQQVVDQFNDMRAAQCMRDSDPRVCPK